MHNVYLVQRGTVIDNPSKNNRFSQNVTNDYMGSSEFEFGALPKSLRYIGENKSAYKMLKIQDFNHEGNVLYFYSNISDADMGKYLKTLSEMRNGTWHGKESSRFEVGRNWGKEADFWWDLDNNVMFSFNKKMMDVLEDSIAVSLKYMNEQKGK